MLASLHDYHKDCRSIIGRTLQHDDSLNDRSEGGVLDTAFNQTKKLWKQEYGEEYFVPGGMYRGEPPEIYYCQGWSASMDNIDWSIRDPLENPQGFLMMYAKDYMEYKEPDQIEIFDDSMPQEWTKVHETAPDGNCGFIAAAAKATKRGQNSNPRRNKYIFGRSPPIHGALGYYHITTREAYHILSLRIKARIRSCESSRCCARLCELIFCCGGRRLEYPCSEPFEKKLAILRGFRDLTEARSKADIPLGVVGIPAEDRQINETSLHCRYTDSSGAWLFPEGCYSAGGGCGATGTMAGGGCGGGGACGAAACGGVDGGGGGCGGCGG